jgi:hypothetical protein
MKNSNVMGNRIEATKRFLKAPGTWPLWPLLPMERKTVQEFDRIGKALVDLELGVMFFGSENFGHGITAYTIFRMNMYEFISVKDSLKTIDDIVDFLVKYEFIVFNGEEDLMKSGWVVA